MFMFRWNSIFVEKVVLERVHNGGRDAFRASYLVYYIVWRVNVSKLL